MFLFLLIAASTTTGSALSRGNSTLASKQKANDDISNICRHHFSFDPFFGIAIIEGIHTFVAHGTSCIPPDCAFTGPAAYDSVGFDTGSFIQIVGQGRLVQETYPCDDPQPSAVMTTQCAREAILLLTERGWPENAYYKVWRVAYYCYNGIVEADCSPSPEGNVCWHFTCAVTDCAIPKIGGYEYCSVTSFLEDVKSGERDPPASWTCSRARYGDGHICDCACGASDPDCVMHLTAPTIGCNGTDVCVPPGQCRPRDEVLMKRKWNRQFADEEPVFDKSYVPDFGFYSANQRHRRVPAQWTCPSAYYGSRDGCDLNCGAPDPDCALYDGMSL